MAKRKPPKPDPAPSRAGRVSVIHLQGPAEERDWLTMANKKTHLPKATIVRLALKAWGATNGLAPYPIDGDDE